MALPKAGCTSFKHALAQVDPDVAQTELSQTDTILAEMNKPESAGVKVWHGVYHTRRFRPHRWSELVDHFRFCVVRDPIRRLMSCYTDLVAPRRIPTHSKRLKQAPELTTVPDPDYSFANLDAYRRRSSMVKHHAMTASVFLGPDLNAQSDRVYRTGEMAVPGDDLSRQTGQIVCMPHANRTRWNLQIDDLLDETIDMQHPFLEVAYAYFRGYFTNPPGPRVHPACAMPL